MGFDPYSDWLGLPAGRRPPDAYGLLGLARFERDPDRIAAAAEARIRQIGHRAPFDRAAEAKRLLKEVRSAKELLTDPARRRRYELSLRQAEKPIPSAPSADSAPAAATEEVDPRRRRLAGVALGGAALLALFVLGVSWRSLRSETVAAPRTTRHGTVTVAEPAPPAAPEKSSGGDVAASPAESPRLTAPPDLAVAQAAPPAVTHVASRPIAPTTTAPVEAPRPPGSPLAEYRVPSFDSPDERRAFSRHLRGLLDEGFATKGSDLGTAPRHHRAATALTDDTALADYALALVAWNRLRFDEAEAALRSAVAGAPAPFLPARRALIRLHLNHGRRDAALREAVAMADALGRAETDATLRTAADESVRWLGRLTAALEAPWQPGEPPAEVLQADEEIRRSLGPALSRVYAEGRRSLRDDYAARSEEVDATVARLVAAHAERQTEELQEIAAERGAADAEQEKVGRTADEWKKWFDEQTAEIDPQLEKLVPQFQQLSLQAEAAWAMFSALNEQITLERDLRPGRPRAVAPVNTASLVVAREQALAQFRLFSGQAAQIRRQAEALIATRQAAVRRFEQATQTLAAESDALKKWKGVLERRRTKTAAHEAEDSPAVRSLRRRLQDLSTYLPFDLDAERKAVLDALENAGGGSGEETK